MVFVSCMCKGRGMKLRFREPSQTPKFPGTKFHHLPVNNSAKPILFFPHPNLPWLTILAGCNH